MTHVEGNYLEISFFKSSEASKNFFKEILDVLLDFGIEYAGTFYYHSVSEKNSDTVKEVYESPVLEDNCSSKELDAAFARKDINIVQVDLVLGKDQGFSLKSKLTYLRIPEEDIDPINPIAIWVSGDMFFDSEDYDPSGVTGYIRNLFVDTARKLMPEIAVITDEAWPLTTLSEMSRNDDSLCFKDFYLNSHLIEGVTLPNEAEEIKSSEGSFIFTSKNLTSSGSYLSYEAQEEFGMKVCSEISIKINSEA